MIARWVVCAIVGFAWAAETAGAQQTMFPPVRGLREMVAAANNFEVEAGYRMLTQGGNAVDAGVAAVLAAAVTEQARFGLGGEMPVLIKMAGKPVISISGVGTAPARATVEYYRSREPEPWERPDRMPPIPTQGLRAAILPGVFDGLILALRQYGTMSFAQVAAPAIEYADAFPMPEEFARFIFNHREVLATWPTSRAFFLPTGAPPRHGEIFRQPHLARTLRELAAVERKARGRRDRKLQAIRDHFYRGPLAARFASHSQENGGLITFDDMKAFHATEERPLSVTFQGYEVYKTGFWTQGPVLLQALQLLEGFDLRSMGHNSPAYVHTVTEALKLAFADRDRYYGDPRFSEIPESTLLSSTYAAERRKLIDSKAASLDHRPGAFGGPLAMPSTATTAGPANDTTCVNVVDRFGNAFSATPSGAWLPSVIAGDTGIPFSSRLHSFVLTAGHANQIAPGKRPRVTLTPTLVLKDGKEYMALSTPGGDNQDQTLVQVLLNILVFGMGPQQAVEAPRFQTEHYYSSFGFHEFKPGVLLIEGRFPPETVQALEAMGHRVTVQAAWGNPSAPTVIQIVDGVLHGGADPRRGRFIFGR
ncbi:MAG: gamma-glutamyltransferase family protein [Bryobacteraceae bacterium]